MSEQTFLDKLAELRAANCDQIPTPQLAVLTRATARLRRSGMLQKCLQSGETVPDFSYIDRNNNAQSLYQLLASGPVVLNFFRGFWCPYCKTELEALALIQEELEKAGCHYLAITPQQEDSVALEDESFEVIFDKQNQIASQFNIIYILGEDEKQLFKEWGIELNKGVDSDTWTLPIPATYLIAQDRTVAFQFTDADFRSRCCPDDLIVELKRLRAS